MAGYRWRSARLGLLFLAVLPSERSNITGTATAAQLFFFTFFFLQQLVIFAVCVVFIFFCFLEEETGLGHQSFN